MNGHSGGADGGDAGMHYIGMASMNMDATVSYSGPFVGMSVLIAIVARWPPCGSWFGSIRLHAFRGVYLAVLGGIVLAFYLGNALRGMAAARSLRAQPH